MARRSTLRRPCCGSILVQWQPLSRSATAVFEFLRRAADKNGQVMLSARAIGARAGGVGRSSASRAIATLAQRGLISVAPSFDESGAQIANRIHLSPDGLLRPDAPRGPSAGGGS